MRKYDIPEEIYALVKFANGYLIRMEFKFQSFSQKIL
ncbi:MAG: hypothetical protein RLZZ67_342 [Candidatus Parcubacteria bacterium]